MNLSNNVSRWRALRREMRDSLPYWNWTEAESKSVCRDAVYSVKEMKVRFGAQYKRKPYVK